MCASCHRSPEVARARSSNTWWQAVNRNAFGQLSEVNHVYSVIYDYYFMRRVALF